MKESKYLPLGSIVKLKGGELKVMVISYLIFPKKGQKKKVFDYGGCIYPTGVIDTDHMIGFNHDDIENVCFLGFKDEEQERMNKALLEHGEELKEDLLSQLNDEDNLHIVE